MDAIGRLLPDTTGSYWPIEDVREGQLCIRSIAGYASHAEGVAKAATVVKLRLDWRSLAT